MDHVKDRIHRSSPLSDLYLIFLLKDMTIRYCSSAVNIFQAKHHFEIYQVFRHHLVRTDILFYASYAVLFVIFVDSTIEILDC